LQRSYVSEDHVRRLIVVVLSVEVLDELFDGVSSAAWPVLSEDLHLSYTQVGLLLGIPGVVGNLIEPFAGFASDLWGRRRVSVVGGVSFTLALTLAALAQHFWMLLFALTLFYPSSGAFVSLAQMDLVNNDEGDRRAWWMVLWNMAGSLGALCGPVLLVAAVAWGGNWRTASGLLAVLSALMTVALALSPKVDHAEDAAVSTWAEAVRRAWDAVKQTSVRWAVVRLVAADALLDFFLGFLALFLVKTHGFSVSQGAWALSVSLGAMLLGNVVLVRVLTRLDHTLMMCVTALASLPALWFFILVPGVVAKFAATVLLGLLVSGWYPVLKGDFYDRLPPEGGTAMAINSITGTLSGFIPMALGGIAATWGLTATMWTLSLGPVVLLLSYWLHRESG